MTTQTSNFKTVGALGNWRSKVEMRFAAIWIALAVIVLVGGVALPRSITVSSIQSILPFAAFLAIAAMGQAIVIMARGIDLSVPAIVTLTSTVLLGASGGTEGSVPFAVTVALVAAVAVGLVNGFFIAVLRLNALIVTLAVGAIVGGLTLAYRQTLQAEATVPSILAEFGGGRFVGVSNSFWVALLVTALVSLILRKTLVGRNFQAVGANPDAARAAGIEIIRYQLLAYVSAALLYGIMGVLISGFIQNPTLEVGGPYLLAPIAAAVLGATSISGGIGSMVSVLGAALFLTQLGQQLRLIGLDTLDAPVGERHRHVGEQRDGLEQCLSKYRHHHVQFEVASASRHSDGRVIPHHSRANHHHRLGHDRVDLARHDRRAWLDRGQFDLVDPRCGARAEPPDIIGDLHEARRDRVQRTSGTYRGIFRGLGLEVVRCFSE